jgi:predicted nucleotidyltransferase
VAASRPLNRLERALRRVGRDLDDLGRPWAVVGALAVSARVEPRFTRDIDLAVSVSGDEEAEHLLHRLQQRGSLVRAVVEQEAVRRLATARLIPPQEDESGIVVDLLFASSGIEPETVSSAESVAVFGELAVPVATVGHLIALKVLSRDDVARPQDRVDLVVLLRVARPADVEEAREALALIARRGFHRGRDLLADLERIRSEVGSPPENRG